MRKRNFGDFFRFHNLVLKFPILKDNDSVKWSKTSLINNWVKKYYFEELPLKLTIEKTSKSIILYLHQKEISKDNFYTDLLQWSLKAVFYCHHFLKERGVVFDYFSGEVIRQHIATKAEEFEGFVDGKSTFEVDLKRSAKSIFKSKERAKVWIDRSWGELEVESNDLLYEEKLVRMPEIVFESNKLIKDFYRGLDSYNKNLKLHLSVMGNINKTLKVMRKELIKDK